MKKVTHLQRVFAPVEAPRGLYEAIMLRIASLERRSARLRAALFGAVALLSGMSLVPVAAYTAQQIYASGFASYLSLIFSDHTLVLTYWQEFALSLVESLPSVALLMLLPLCAALIWSLRSTIRTARAAFA